MVDHIKDLGEIIKCMVMVYIHGQMVDNIKVIILKIKKMDMVYIYNKNIKGKYLWPDGRVYEGDWL